MGQMRMKMEVGKRVGKWVEKGYARKMTKRGLGPVSPEKKRIFDSLLLQKFADLTLDQARSVCL